MAAVACVHGAPGWLLVTSSDPAERAALVAVARRAVEIRQGLDRRLASLIRAEVRKIFP